MKVSRLRVGFQFLLHVVLISHVLAFYYLDWKEIGALDFQGFFHHLLGAGVLTAGALLTAVMFLAAFIFGRLFCSWGCHFGATQDLAAWILRKLGWKPPFVKTRILHLAPYAMLVGVFLLPPVRQWIKDDWGPFKVDFAGTAPGLAPWDTLPGWLLSAVTFLACGAGILLFLGTRGFCRFVCPYGAVFRIADKVTLFRVRRTAPCSSTCGSSGVHPCTAACPTAIDVHRETQAWGKVIDSDCVRCHLCIEACPNHSLAYAARASPVASAVLSGGTSLGEAGPALGPAPAQPPAAGSTFRPLGVPVWTGKPPSLEPAVSLFTLPLWGEVLILSVALVTYFACDLVYGGHFLAATIALAEGFLTFLVVCAAAGDGKASLLGRPFRRGRSWTFFGISAAGLLALSIFPIFEGGAFKVLRWQALRLDPPTPRAADAPAALQSLQQHVSLVGSAHSRLAAAAECYARALEYFPADLETRRLLLNAYVRLNDRRAVAAAEELVRRSPENDATAREALLWVYRRYGEREKAGAWTGEGKE